jgi:hypothetical protein
MNTGEITDEMWGEFSQQEEQEKGFERADDYECKGGSLDDYDECKDYECKDGSLDEQHRRIDFSHHRDMTKCTESEIEDHLKEKMNILAGQHACMEGGQCYTSRLSKRQGEYYPHADFVIHFCLATGINERNGGEHFATIMENCIISDKWLPEDPEPNVNTVKRAYTPASSKYTTVRDGALYVAIPCSIKYPDPATFKMKYRSPYMLRKASEWKSKWELGTTRHHLGTSRHQLGAANHQLGIDKYSLETDAFSLDTASPNHGTGKGSGGNRQGTTWTQVLPGEHEALVFTSPIAEHKKIKRAMKQPTRDLQFIKLHRAHRSGPLRKCGLATKSGGGINAPKAKKLATYFLDNQKIY